MSIAIAYTDAGSTTYDVTITQFTDNAIPRQYNNTASFEYGLAGATQLNGPAFRQKNTWIVDALIPSADAQVIDSMFRAWDQDRADGVNAAVGLTDTCFGATINTTAVFSTAPSYTYNGPAFTGVSFVLSEV